MKTFSWSYVKYSPRVPLLLLTVEKIESENSILFFLFLSFFSIKHNSKAYAVYEQFAHQTNPLLLEIFLFLVRATCELLSMSYYWRCLFSVLEVDARYEWRCPPPNTCHSLLPISHFCVYSVIRHIT